KSLGSVQVVPIFLRKHPVSSFEPRTITSFHLPRFGRGSSSCAGSEKRTEAMSVTPTNLNHAHASALCSYVVSGGGAYLRRMPRKVFSLEESSGAFSGVASTDDMADEVVET